MPAKARAPGWGKETVLRELEDGSSVRDICKRYSLETGYRALVTEIQQWRVRDADFKVRYDALMDERDPNRSGGAPSKEEKDPSLGDWRVKFCEDLFRTGSRLKAAESSPYSYQLIYQKITEGYRHYEPDFAELVQLTEMRLCAEMEGAMVDALREAAAPRDKAWIAKAWLERRDPRRWGRQVELLHSGSIRHEHTHTHRLSREERLEALVEDQQEFFGAAGEQAALPPADAGEVIDLEPIPEPEPAHRPQESDANHGESVQA